MTATRDISGDECTVYIVHRLVATHSLKSLDQSTLGGTDDGYGWINAGTCKLYPAYIVFLERIVVKLDIPVPDLVHYSTKSLMDLVILVKDT